MEVLQNEQEKIALHTFLPAKIMAGLNEAKWRERKTRSAIIIELLNKGLYEKLGDDYEKLGNEFINNSKTE
ncbi:MAG: hypothetical protein HUU38_30880 [Anaerolineales bacterium]|nr:hypothetical protein [Anaerolineales bacterium]